MGFWFPFWLFIASTVVSVLLQKRPQDAKKAGESDFQVPTAEENRSIPVIFGTVIQKGPNVVWWGNLNARPIKTHAGGFLGIGAKTVITGYKYYASLVMALCQGPIDELVDITVGDKSLKALPKQRTNRRVARDAVIPNLPEAFTAAGTDFDIWAEKLFGGDAPGEGGISGHMRFYYGSDSQSADATVAAAWGGTGPGWRGLTYCTFDGYLGQSQYIKNWAFVMRRCPTPAGFDSSKANIDGDANPAHMIYEIMTDPTWGLGIPASRFDLPTWTAAASALYSEGFGMSIIIDSDTSADEAMGDILQTIDGTVFTDPSTGLWTIKLARKDYNADTLTEFTESDMLEDPEWTRGLWSETMNEVKVEYCSRAHAFTTRVFQAQETANYQVQGFTASTTLSFPGVSNATLANKIAHRELKTLSYPLAQFKLQLTRKAYALRPGSVFKLSWAPPSGTVFEDMVLRVKTIRYGALEAGQIEVEAVEDIFNVASTAYGGPGGTGWENPISAPAVASASALFEVPYHLVGEKRYVMANAARGDTTSFLAEVWVDEGNGYHLGNELESFTPSGVLASSYSAKTSALDTVGFTVAAGGVDLDRLIEESTDDNGLARGENLALFADTGEIVAWETATKNGDGSYTISGVLRGVLDTVPAEHSAGARVWFISDGACTTAENPYAADLTVTAKMLPRNALDIVDLDSASSVSITTASRAWKPYPPANVKINTLALPSWPSTTVGDAALTWSHRNRTTQGIGGQMVAQDIAGSYTLEGTITVEVLVGGVVKRTFTGITGTSQTYTAAQRISDDADGTKAVAMRITPINGSYQGTRRTTPAVVMTGLGMTLGNYLGGIQG